MSSISSLPWHGEPTAALVVVGVTPHQGADVVLTAAWFAARLGASLVCLWTDESHLTIGRGEDGTVLTTPLDPDQVDDEGRPNAVEELHDRMKNILTDSQTAWRLRYAAGSPAKALHEVAEELDATAIAIGTRDKGFSHWAAEKIDGSVAVWLARNQHRPVILIPPAKAQR